MMGAADIDHHLVQRLLEVERIDELLRGGEEHLTAHDVDTPAAIIRHGRSDAENLTDLPCG